MTAPKIDDYKEGWTFFESISSNMHGNQPGEPKAGVERIDVVESEGMAEGQEIPLRIPIRPDAL